LKQATKSMAVEKLSFPDHNLLKNLCGEHDKHLKIIENLEPVKLKAWGNNITVSGNNDNVGKIISMLKQLYSIMEKGWHIQPADIDYAHRILSEDVTFELERIFLDTVFISSKKRVTYPQEHSPETLY